MKVAGAGAISGYEFSKTTKFRKCKLPASILKHGIYGYCGYSFRYYMRYAILKTT